MCSQRLQSSNSSQGKGNPSVFPGSLLLLLLLLLLLHHFFSGVVDIFLNDFICFVFSSHHLQAQVRVGVFGGGDVGTSLACDMSLVMAARFRLIIDACN